MGTQSDSPLAYQFGPYQIDVAAGQLRKRGTRIKLAGQPLEILVMLLERAGQVVTREEIQARLWADKTFVDFENSLNKAINKVRQALADSADQPAYIETLPRRGYRFIAPVTAASAGESAPEPPPGPAHPDLPGTVGATRSPGRSLAWIRYVFGFAALALGVLFLASGWQRRNQAITSVAVLPLRYLSGEPGQPYLADGITDELTTQLAKTGGFRVTSGTSAMQFRESNKSARQIAHDLGVDALIEGSIERAGDRVRIRAQLILASTDQHLWADSYDGDVSDLLTLEDRVARDIALKVAVKLTAAQERRFVRTRPVNREAYLDYLRGRYYWNQRTGDGLEKALNYFQAAIDKDPDYAVAHAGLADTYILLGDHSRPQSQTIALAHAAARRALRIENSAEAHASLGLIALNYDWDWQTAEKEFRTAIDLNPNYSTAHHWYGETFLALTGRFDEALAEMKLAAELDPLSPIISTDVGVTLYLARRYDGAIPQLVRTLELYPDYEQAQVWLVRAYEQKKQCREAISILDTGSPRADTLLRRQERARIYAECGRRGEALGILQDIQKQASSEFMDPFVSGIVYIGLGRKDEALTQLEKAVPVHSTALTSLKVLPIYDPLRADPRFAALMRTVHLSP